MSKQACLSYWWPRVQDAGVRAPVTSIVRTSDVGLEASLLEELVGDPEHKPSAQERVALRLFREALVEAAQSVAQHVGGEAFPCFLRTDHISGKHDWDECCYVKDASDMMRHVFALVERSLLMSPVGGGLPVDVWAVRQVIPTSPAWVTRHGLPIVAERRVFIRGCASVTSGEVMCLHPYWGEEEVSSFEDRLFPADWREQLAAINHVTNEERALLTYLSLRVAREIGGEWSLDWLRDSRGEWWAIDMAPAHLSWHPACGGNAGRGVRLAKSKA